MTCKHQHTRQTSQITGTNILSVNVSKTGQHTVQRWALAADLSSLSTACLDDHTHSRPTPLEALLGGAAHHTPQPVGILCQSDRRTRGEGGSTRPTARVPGHLQESWGVSLMKWRWVYQALRRDVHEGSRISLKNGREQINVWVSIKRNVTFMICDLLSKVCPVLFLSLTTALFQHFLHLHLGIH